MRDPKSRRWRHRNNSSRKPAVNCKDLKLRLWLAAINPVNFNNVPCNVNSNTDLNFSKYSQYSSIGLEYFWYSNTESSTFEKENGDFAFPQTTPSLQWTACVIMWNLWNNWKLYYLVTITVSHTVVSMSFIRGVLASLRNYTPSTNLVILLQT